MKWLIYGARGWIGQQVVALIAKQNATQENKELVIAGTARVDDLAAIAAELDEVRPDRVLSFIGRTHGPGCSTIDYLEQKGKLVENVRDNLFSPVALALLCQERGIHVTALGTGCIFTSEYPLDGPGFADDALPNFVGSSYSVVKGYTDRLSRLLGESSQKLLTLRIRMPLTADRNGRNFITKITKYAKVVDIPNSMSVLSTLLPVLLDMARKERSGVYNFVNPGVISHNEVLSLYKEIVDPSFTWENFTLAEQDAILAAGRSNCHLDTSKLLAEYPDLPPIGDAVRALMHEMKAADDAAADCCCEDCPYDCNDKVCGPGGCDSGCREQHDEKASDDGSMGKCGSDDHIACECMEKGVGVGAQ